MIITASEDYYQQTIIYGNYAGTWVSVAVDADGSLLLADMEVDQVKPDTDEHTTWDATLTTIVNNLNRIRNQVVSITGETWGNVSHSLASVWAKFHQTTGHKHTAVAGDGPQLDHGQLGGMTDDDHVRYFDKDCSKALTGTYLLRSVNNGLLAFVGGTGQAPYSALIQFYGGEHASYPGRVEFLTPNAAGTGYEYQMSMTGKTDTPVMSLHTNRIIDVADPTAAQDAATKNFVDAVGKAWAAWTPTETWSGATPASVTRVARWTRIGRVVFFAVYVNSTDSNGATGLTLSLPVTPSNPGVFHQFTSMQIYGASGSTYGNPLAYLNESSSLIQFLSFQPATDGQRIAIRVTGFYEVS